MSRRVESALLVDDDDAFRTTLQSALRRRGVTARTAATVDEGLFALEDAPVGELVVESAWRPSDKPRVESEGWLRSHGYLPERRQPR